MTQSIVHFPPHLRQVLRSCADGERSSHADGERWSHADGERWSYADGER